MAITSSAKRAIRSSDRKRVFNLRRKNTLTDTTKLFMKALSTKNIKEAEKLLEERKKKWRKVGKLVLELVGVNTLYNKIIR